MEREKFILKKDWRGGPFRVCVTNGEGSVETNVDAFAARVTDLCKASVPRNLAWTVKMTSMQQVVESLVKQALDQAILEMKTDTIKQVL